MTTRMIGLGVTLLAVTTLAGGCWSRVGGSGYVMSGFEEQGVVRVAVLPAVNQTEWVLAPEAMQRALSGVLTKEKKYEVIAREKVTAVLGRGGGGSTWTRMIEAMNMGEDPGDLPLGRLARDLEADALLSATIVSFHQTVEERPATSPQGQIYYRHFPTTVIQTRAFLWGSRANAVVWRGEHLERYYHEPGAEGIGQPARIAEIAARELLSRLPENTWRPATTPQQPNRPE